MIHLAHHGAEVPAAIAWLIAFAGPALLAFRCWLWERRNADHDHDDH